MHMLVGLSALLTLSARPIASQPLHGQSSIVVAIVTDTLGQPLSGADVQIVGTSIRGNTDASGRVALLAVPLGKVMLRVRRLGFAENTIPLTVTPGIMPDARASLTPVALDLSRVVVKSSMLKPDRYARTGKYDAFYQRRAKGLGTFFTREDIDSRRAQRSEDLLRMATGVRIRYRGTVPFIQFVRCAYVNVYIDGFRSHDGYAGYFALSPLDIEAMEIYHGLASLPPEFSPRPSDCAAIVVWTRWHANSN